MYFLDTILIEVENFISDVCHAIRTFFCNTALKNALTFYIRQNTYQCCSHKNE